MTWSLRAPPLIALLSYLAATVLLFFAGPLPWPISNPLAVLGFLTAALAGVCAGYLIGVHGTPKGSPLTNWRVVIVAGAALAVILLFPSAYYFAAKMPWDILDAMSDQNAVYRAFEKRLAETQGGRAFASIARTLAFPLIFAVIPLGILRWRSMTWRLWALWTATAAGAVTFSILRGTDREIFDLLMVAGGGALVAIGRECVSHQFNLRQLLFRRSVVSVGVAAVVVLGLALLLFADRRLQRLGWHIDQRYGASAVEVLSEPEGWCAVMRMQSTVPMQSVCAERNHILLNGLDYRAQYAVVILTAYLTNGYYGLSLALTQEHRSTLGIGHSQALTRLYERVTGDASLYQRGVTFKLRSLEWSDVARWSTIFPWFANDVGWPGAIFMIAVAALLWGRSWRDAVGASNDSAGIVFCFLFQLFVYLPANNQLAQTLDAYFAFVVWLGFWLVSSRRVRLTFTP